RGRRTEGPRSRRPGRSGRLPLHPPCPRASLHRAAGGAYEVAAPAGTACSGEGALMGYPAPKRLGADRLAASRPDGGPHVSRTRAAAWLAAATVVLLPFLSAGGAGAATQASGAPTPAPGAATVVSTDVSKFPSVLVTVSLP